MWKLVGKKLDQAIIIFPFHADINIIIPRDEAVVAYCAKESTPVSEIFQMMLIANINDNMQYLNLPMPVSSFQEP